MVRVTKDLLPRRRRSDHRLPLWTTLWFCIAMFLLGALVRWPSEGPHFPFDIHLESPGP